MFIAKQIAEGLRAVHFGGNWTSVNLKDSLSDVDWREANEKVGDLNTIVALVFHINYYIDAVIKVLEGGALDAHDRFSFDHPFIATQEDWERLLDKLWADAERIVALAGALPDERLSETFADPKYGTYYRNLQGLIEHTHYHLGQIVLIKKMIRK